MNIFERAAQDIASGVQHVENFFDNASTPASTVGKVISSVKTAISVVAAFMPAGVPAKVAAVLGEAEDLYTIWKTDVLPEWDDIKSGVESAVTTLLQDLEDAGTSATGSTT